MTRVAFATVRGRYTLAVVQAFRKEIATARAANWMRWENAEEPAGLMPMPMAFAMTWTPVLEPWTPAECAMVRGLFTNAAAMIFQQRIAIARGTKMMRWAFAEETARQIPMPMACAMWMRYTGAPMP
jgi:hypothetical protein